MFSPSTWEVKLQWRRTRQNVAGGGQGDRPSRRARRLCWPTGSSASSPTGSSTSGAAAWRSAAEVTEWLAQQIRQLTPFGGGPTFLIRDNDRKFGQALDAVARGAGTQVVRKPLMSPKANAHVERMIGSIRRECLDHMLVHNEQHLHRTMPVPLATIVARPVLDGLHHDYRAAA
jgi:hypothetical protein